MPFLGTFKQGVSKQGVMTFAWRPGSQHDVAATRGADSVLASDCRGWSSFNKERMSHLCDSTVAGLTARRDNVLASKCEYPPFRYPPFKCALPFKKGQMAIFGLFSVLRLFQPLKVIS